MPPLLLAPKGYGRGGYLQPGGLGANYGSQSERGLTPSNTQSFDRLVVMLESGGMGPTASLDGMRLTGTLTIDGLPAMIDARVSAGISFEASAVRARPRR